MINGNFLRWLLEHRDFLRSQRSRLIPILNFSIDREWFLRYWCFWNLLVPFEVLNIGVHEHFVKFGSNGVSFLSGVFCLSKWVILLCCSTWLNRFLRDQSALDAELLLSHKVFILWLMQLLVLFTWSFKFVEAQNTQRVYIRIANVTRCRHWRFISFERYIPTLFRCAAHCSVVENLLLLKWCWARRD